jgi:phosphoenolpyruvate synthase/pyruvate phosphate dikinase
MNRIEDELGALLMLMDLADEKEVREVKGRILSLIMDSTHDEQLQAEAFQLYYETFGDGSGEDGWEPRPLDPGPI